MQAMQEGNPTRLASRGLDVPHPPTLILQGTVDKNVTPEMQENFAKSYRAAGGSVDLEIFVNEPHLFALTPGPDTDRANQLTKNFIAAQIRKQYG
jgi:acetyl esterase/lipase